MQHQDIPTTRTNPPKITYADASMPRLHRAIIGTMEGVTGRWALKRRYKRYLRAAQGRAGPVAWDLAVENLGIKLDIEVTGATRREGRGLLVIANHPFGIVDGIILSWIASRLDPEFKVIANGVLLQEPTLLGNLLPISFSGTRDANRTNVATRRAAIDRLNAGGVVGIFPAGGVAWSPAHGQPVRDDFWKPMTGKLIKATRCDVLPVRFAGSNSLPFHLASRHSQVLRYGLFLNEIRNKLDRPVGIELFDPIRFEDMPDLDAEALTQHLRQQLGV